MPLDYMFSAICNSMCAKMYNLCPKTSKNGHKWPYLDSRFWVFKRACSRLLNFSIYFSILTFLIIFFHGMSECGRQFFFEKLKENPNSKLSVKFSSPFILKISWKNIEKCKSLTVLENVIVVGPNFWPNLETPDH